MLRRVSILLVAIGASVWCAGDLFAQAQGFGGAMLSGQGGGGMGMGSSSSGSSFGGTGSSAGSSMSGTNGTGMTMMSAASLSGGFGVLGFGAANGFGSGSGAGSMYGGRTYGSVTSAGGTSTAGAAGGNRTATSTASTGAGRGGATSGTSSRRRTSTSSGSASKQQPVWFEPRIEIGFDVPPAKVSVVATSVAASLGATQAGSRFGDVRVAVDGQTAILRGAVASPNDRQLAEQIALLEPSIVSVRNELTVKKSATPSVPAATR